MFSSNVLTIMGGINAAVAFLLASGDLPRPWSLAVGALSAALSAWMGYTHAGTAVVAPAAEEKKP